MNFMVCGTMTVLTEDFNMTDMLKKYQAAEKLTPWNVKDAVLNGTVHPQAWDDTHFFYAKEVRYGDRVISLS